jgi:choline dehydrogenase-like flavoprotein
MILRYGDYGKNATYDTDILVVGTGAGGAVIGAELAAAGLDVTFVEEGGYHATSTFNPYLTESGPRLYRDSGATLIFGNPPMNYLEGRCVGGGTVINGGMMYRPPEDVLVRWQKTIGANELSPKNFEPFLDRVEKAVCSRKQPPESIGADNRLMQRGAELKGWEYSPNKRGHHHCVGSSNCVIGCPTGAKQSMLVSYIPSALAAGARCLTEVRVEKLLLEGDRCVGVRGRAINSQTLKREATITIKARDVILACGAVQTPLLLLGHPGMWRSRQLGRNFTVHPNIKVIAVYPHIIDSWKGVSQLGQTRQFRDEGILFAENMVPPSAAGSTLPFIGDKLWDIMKRYRSMIVTGILVEDSSTGRILRGPFAMPIPIYNITDYDHQRFLKGARLLAGMHFEMGADMVILPFHTMSIAHSPDDLCNIDSSRIRRTDLELFTPHLMGTARMGSNPKNSVVDSSGQLWDLQHCYIADASLFPSPVGVNPQITIMALASFIAAQLLEKRAHQRHAA